MEKREIYLHPDEEKAMNALADAWNALGDALVDEQLKEAAGLIHQLQRIVLANVTARAFSDKYRTDR